MNNTLRKFLTRYVVTNDKLYSAQVLPDAENWKEDELLDQANELVVSNPHALATIKAEQLELGNVTKADTVGLQKATLQIDPLWFYNEMGYPKPLGTIQQEHRQLIEKINTTISKDGTVELLGYTLLSKQKALDILTKIATTEKETKPTQTVEGETGVKFGLQS